MLRGAIIGFGNIATRGHLPAYRDHEVADRLHIAAVMDVVGQTREKARELLPGAKFYPDIHTLLADEELDFVDICTPPQAHAHVIDACVQNNIHLICEKPLAHTAAISAELVEKIRGAGVVFMPCHQYKYSPLWKTIGEIVMGGGIGKTTFAQFNVFRMQADSGTAAWNPGWRTDKHQSGGGILVDTGAHYLYLAVSMFGEPNNVSSVLKTLKHFDYSVEDTALVTLEYDDKLVQLNLTWAASSRANTLLITGTEGTLSYTGTSLRHTLNGNARELPMPDISDKQQYVAWYVSLFREFSRRVEEHDTRGDLIDEAAIVMKLLDLSYRRSEREEMSQIA